MPATSFTVGAIFDVQISGAEAALTELSNRFAGLDELIRSTQANLQALGRSDSGMFAGLSGGLASVGRAMTELGANIDGVAARITSAMGEAVRAATAAARATADAAGAAMAGGGGGRGGGGGMPRFINPPGSVREPEPPPFSLPSTAAFRLESEQSPLPLGGIQGGFDFGAPNPMGYGRNEPIATMPSDRPWATSAETAIPPPPIDWNEARRPPPPEEETAEGRIVAEKAKKQREGGGFLGLGMIGDIFAATLGIDAAKNAMKAETGIENTLTNLNIKPGDPNYESAKARLKAVAMKSAEGTRYAWYEQAEYLEPYSAVSTFKGEEGIQNIEAGFPINLRAAEVQAGYGLGTAKANIVASEEIGHLMQGWTAPERKRFTDLTTNIALMTHSTPAAQLAILKYAEGIGQAAGMDPLEVAAEVGSFELRTGQTSRAGTAWSAVLSEVFGAVPGKTPRGRNTARAAERAFGEALRLDPEARAHDGAHTAAARKTHYDWQIALGIRDAKGNITGLNAEGKLENMDAWREDVSRYAATHTPAQTIAATEGAVGRIGARYLLDYTTGKALDRDTAVRMGLEAAPTTEERQALLQRQTIQQLGQTKALAGGTSAEIASSALPAMNTGLQGLNAVLSQVLGFISGNPDYAAGSAAGIGGLLMKGTAGALHRWGGSALGGILGPILGPLGSAAALAGLAYGPIVGGIPGVGGGIHDKSVARGLPSIFYDDQGKLKMPWEPSHPTTDTTTPRAPPPPAHPEMGARQGPTSITVNVGPITMNGVADESTFRNILARLQDALKNALHTATGTAQGVMESPYSYGGMP